MFLLCSSVMFSLCARCHTLTSKCKHYGDPHASTALPLQHSRNCVSGTNMTNTRVDSLQRGFMTHKNYAETKLRFTYEMELWHNEGQSVLQRSLQSRMESIVHGRLTVQVT